MSLTKEEVQKVAFLARLNITEEESETLSSELSNILGHIDNLAQVNTQDTSTVTSSLQESELPLHVDTEHTGDFINDFREEFKENAPATEGNFFKVPKIKKNVKS